ncbi:MAG: hypothetical protein A2664_01405 [Candidatus Taylorbacteria bacterium RIFCSPHIGHO2_01_FULL_46_22b]|uniref:RNA polymerase sigma factor n=1 Tax=Candidatus Taylorbacteria bacterium RIFCSPHIGHO2_01_FULL_46_22b TaxID=1802301 RepID=A0A1G2M270_9BACT|nr:MAG: hypothetical protein A2664_01405 [Candidatus Taylorbacteria bacterium RIFCSPHIGHO2_01_FULL_46_22b]
MPLHERKQLWKRLSMKDIRSELNTAFELYTDELFRHSFFRLSNRDLALDTVQECFLRVWRYVQKGGKIENMRAFLFRTLHNLIVDEYRKTKTSSLDELLEGEDSQQQEASLLHEDTNELEAAMNRFDARQVLPVLKELPDLYSEVLMLRYVEGLSPKEISSIIGESENVVSVRIFRAIRKMKEVFEQKKFFHE